MLKKLLAYLLKLWRWCLGALIADKNRDNLSTQDNTSEVNVITLTDTITMEVQGDFETKGEAMMAKALDAARNLLASHPDSPLLQYCPIILPSYANSDTRRFGSLEEICTKIAETSRNEFCWSTCFDPDFLADVLYEGFFTMGVQLHDDVHNSPVVVAPKIHTSRCVIDLKDFRVPKSTRRYAREYTMTFDKCFDRVCEGVIKQHGPSWFYPPLVKVFKLMQARGEAKCGFSRRRNGHGVASMHSIELWKGDILVAGEVGVQIGRIYISFSGFSFAKNAGMVQLCALGCFLHQQGIEMWDLGMIIPYKMEIGGKSLPRSSFLKRFKQFRDAGDIFLTLSETNAKQIIMQRRQNIHSLTKSAFKRQNNSKRSVKSRLKRERRNKLSESLKNKAEPANFEIDSFDLISTGNAVDLYESKTWSVGHACPVKQKITSILTDSLRAAYIKHYNSGNDVQFNVEEIFPKIHVKPRRSKRSYIGDYYCCDAIAFSRLIRKNLHANSAHHDIDSCSSNLARVWAEAISCSPDAQQIISRVQANYPTVGFINIYLKAGYIEGLLQNLRTKQLMNHNYSRSKDKIVLDFSSPNVAKMLHVGHLRSTLIGDSLQRIFKFCGYEVTAVNHVGDFGTQIGMLLEYVLQCFSPQQQEDLIKRPEKFTSDTLMEIYRLARQRFDEDDDFKHMSKERVVDMQHSSAESKVYQLWKSICEVSRSNYSEIYRLLNVQLQEMGESFYSPHLLPCINELIEQQIAKQSRGSQKVLVNVNGKDVIVRKSDGAYSYASTDLAAIRFRTRSMKADKIIYVTDVGQSSHFENMFSIAERAGWIKYKKPVPKHTSVEHVSFGLVRKDDGSKIQTRSGQTSNLIDYLNDSIKFAAKVLKNGYRENKDKDLQTLAEGVGIALVKYAEIKKNRNLSYIFSFDTILGRAGERRNKSALYLLFTYRRAKSLIGEDSMEGDIQIMHESEKRLAIELVQFKSVIHRCLCLRSPHILADFCWNIARRFNRFYNDCPVKGDELESSRLTIIHRFCSVLKTGLNLLEMLELKRFACQPHSNQQSLYILLLLIMLVGLMIIVADNAVEDSNYRTH